MKNENAIMDRIKARIAYHANEHRHTYEIGKGVMDFLRATFWPILRPPAVYFRR